jgi:hypothetical protein
MVNFLSKIEDLGISSIHQIRRVCLEFERVAREIVDRAQPSLKRRKMQNNQGTSKTGQVCKSGRKLMYLTAGADRFSSSQVDETYVVSVTSTYLVDHRLISPQKSMPGCISLDSERIPTTLPLQTFGEGVTNGYMDQDAIFATDFPLWNSENLHENLLAEFLPQPYGQLDMSLGLE